MVHVRLPDGASVPAQLLSHGTAEQVYLLLRVAIVERLANKRRPCPLVMDDITVQSDTQRTTAILETLQTLAGERQIILFTQEDDVLRSAQEHLRLDTVDRLHQLSSPRVQREAGGAHTASRADAVADASGAILPRCCRRFVPRDGILMRPAVPVSVHVAGRQCSTGAPMDVIFGMEADGRAYPDFPGHMQGALDVDVVGPAGLLDILETQLGLAGPQRPKRCEWPPTRRSCARQASRDRTGSSPHRSTRIPGHGSSARRLARSTDRCRMVRRTDRDRRIDDLAAAEVAGPDLPTGQSDRFRAALAALDGDVSLDLASLTIIGGRGLLPPQWRRLVAALGARGVTVIDEAAAGGLAPLSDLRRAQDFLGGSVIAPLVDDGSLVLVDADTSLMAAEALAEWLGAGTEGQLEGTVV